VAFFLEDPVHPVDGRPGRARRLYREDVVALVLEVAGVQVIVPPAECRLYPVMEIHERLIFANLDRAFYVLVVGARPRWASRGVMAAQREPRATRASTRLDPPPNGSRRHRDDDVTGALAECRNGDGGVPRARPRCDQALDDLGHEVVAGAGAWVRRRWLRRTRGRRRVFRESRSNVGGASLQRRGAPRPRRPGARARAYRGSRQQRRSARRGPDGHRLRLSRLGDLLRSLVLSTTAKR